MAFRAPGFPFALSLALPIFCLFLLVGAQTTTDQVLASTPQSNNDTTIQQDTDGTVGWVSNPKRRGTLTLLIECMSTIFACTWTVLHLNVPATTDSIPTRVIRKTKWMCITFLFPEFIFAKAVCELRFALYTLDCMNELIDSSPEEFKEISDVRIDASRSSHVLWLWKVEFKGVKRLFHSILLGHRPPPQPSSDRPPLGSRIKAWPTEVQRVFQDHPDPTPACKEARVFVISERHRNQWMRKLTKVDESGKSVEEWKTFSEKSFLERDSHIGDTGVARVQKWTLAHAYYVNMGGIVARKVMHDPSQNTKEPIVNSYSVLRFDDLTDSRWTETGLGHPLKALRLSAQDIMDKSEADWIVKIIAVVQIARLIFDLATRALLDQPVT